MANFTETQIRKMKEVERTQELRAVFDAFPKLKETQFFDSETGLIKVKPNDAETLLNIFRNNQHPIDTSIQVARVLLRTSLKSVLLIEMSDEIKDSDNSEAQALKVQLEREVRENFAYADAVFERA